MENGTAARERRDGGSSLRRAWWTTFALTLIGLFAFAAPWASNTPIGSYPDEYFHAYWARAAVTGQMFSAERGAGGGLELQAIELPAHLQFESVDGPVTCYLNQPAVPAGCGFVAPTTAGDVIVTISPSRYPPAYYLVAGLPTLLADVGIETGRAIWILSRLAGALACSALLAAAVATAGASIGRRRAFTIALLALLPMGVYYASAINPNGLEIYAAIATAMFTLAARERLRRGSSTRGPAWGIAAAFAVLVNARPLSLVMAALLLIGLVLVIAPPVADALRLVRANIGPTLLALAGVAVAIIWFLSQYVPYTSANAEASDAFRGFGLIERFTRASARIDELFPEYVIVTGWLDTWPPAVVHVAWYAFVAVAVVMSWRVARPFHRAIVVLGAVSLVAPVVIMALSGIRWQGRYTLPLVGPWLAIVLWGLAVGADAGRGEAWVDRFLRVGLGLMVATTAVAMYWTVIRFSYGLQPDVLFPNLAVPHGTAVWRPPLGLPVGALVAVAGVITLLVVWSRLARVDETGGSRAHSGPLR